MHSSLLKDRGGDDSGEADDHAYGIQDDCSSGNSCEELQGDGSMQYERDFDSIDCLPEFEGI